MEEKERKYDSRLYLGDLRHANIDNTNVTILFRSGRGVGLEPLLCGFGAVCPLRLNQPSAKLPKASSAVSEGCVGAPEPVEAERGPWRCGHHYCWQEWNVQDFSRSAGRNNGLVPVARRLARV